ncbi:Cytochrome c oxidase polypeptide II [Lutibaculum baratangense AMV1]|uniref:Cytochrome c oxidase polypeptide II n=2 Tax=Lutibaculum TaxID=1358438 RepID=V4RI28_9HYPH|nr:c-type cytochrome, methanol metabolism-related [Lutibaculum baratangense]ESR25796.1 Cytochrome c oxidase polypeptide II [Lutibaculum baratangense AMV1]
MLLKQTMLTAALALALCGPAVAQSTGPGDPEAVDEDDGRYYDADGLPTFNIAEDGTVDFPTYSGFRRYHAECHVCHGPDGLGSTYAPSLVQSVRQKSYETFVEVVVNGREHVDSGNRNVMPAFGTNPNVMCYLDDIYTYLRARAQGDLPRGRPANTEPKSDTFSDMENACMG